eukprot:m.260826 g.260826  ORF g.260826 m.260826 type:complete len:61 (+) comp15567_c0_seq4:333-515(+)
MPFKGSSILKTRSNHNTISIADESSDASSAKVQVFQGQLTAEQQAHETLQTTPQTTQQSI